MSGATDEEEGGSATKSVADRTLLRRIADLVVRAGIPLAVVAVVIAVFLGERMSIDFALSVMVPRHVQPGASAPVRAYVLEESEAGGIARLPIELELRDRRGRVIARARLRDSIAGGAEGAIEIPEDASGWIGVRAIARDGGEIVATSETSIRAVSDPPALPLRPRTARALAQFALGEIETLAGPAPSPFDVRIAGGSCVPEARCDVLVLLGDPTTTVAIAPDGITIEPPRHGPISVLPMVVHGPEAEIALVASRAAPIARRTLRVPIALATPALTIARRVGASPRPRLRAEVLGDRPGVIVDAYQDGQWRHTGSFRPGARDVALPYELEPGLWRLQVHTDPFSSARSAVRTIVVHAPGSSPDQAIRALGDAPGGPEERLAWLSAEHEDAIIPLPPSINGYTADLERLEARQRVLRSAAGAALLIGILIAAILFFRRGVDAAKVAQRVMAATGDPELASARHRRRTLLSALAIVATVLLAFVGAAALIAARAHLFE